MSDIYHEGLEQLALLYTRKYEEDGRCFIGCFLKYGSIRTACDQIVRSFKRRGIFKELKGDFSEYANKQEIADKWKPVLADILLIIYSIRNV